MYEKSYARKQKTMGSRIASAIHLLGFAITFVVLGNAAFAQSTTKIAAEWLNNDGDIKSDAQAYARFGTAVDIDGDILVAGAPFWDNKPANRNDVGRVHIYRRAGSNWVLDEHITSPEFLASGGRFGYSVAIAGQVVVVGAPGLGIGGRAYVYRLTTAGPVLETYDKWTGQWTTLDYLEAINPQAGADFGHSVDVDRTESRSDFHYIAVGEPFRDNSGTDRDTGEAYVFQRRSPNVFNAFVSRLGFDAVPAGIKGRFGWDVAIYAAIDTFGPGRLVIVGVPSDDVGSLRRAGSIAVFVAGIGSSNGWELDPILRGSPILSGSQQGGQFGSSVGISRWHVIAGAPHEERSHRGDGAAYIYERDFTSVENDVPQTILSPSPAPSVLFGYQVDIRGEYALASSPWGNSTGEAYLFRDTGTSWVSQRVLTSNPREGEDRHGISAALGLGHAVVGSQDNILPDGRRVFQAGAVYVTPLP